MAPGGFAAWDPQLRRSAELPALSLRRRIGPQQASCLGLGGTTHDGRLRYQKGPGVASHASLHRNVRAESKDMCPYPVHSETSPISQPANSSLPGLPVTPRMARSFYWLPSEIQESCAKVWAHFEPTTGPSSLSFRGIGLSQDLARP